MLKVTIPTPCHEDWNKMTANNQGRHCNSCMKTVVDFTNMTDHEVQNFLINKKEEHVCGRFSNKQLERIRIELPSNIFQLQMPLWKKFLVASLIVFSTTLFSCEIIDNNIGRPDRETTVGVMIPVIDSTNDVVTADTTISIIEEQTQGEPMIMGGIAPLMIEDTIVRPVTVCEPITGTVVIGKPILMEKKDTVTAKQSEPVIKGEIQFIPDSTKMKRNNCPDGI